MPHTNPSLATDFVRSPEFRSATTCARVALTHLGHPADERSCATIACLMMLGFREDGGFEAEVAERARVAVIEALGGSH